AVGVAAKGGPGCRLGSGPTAVVSSARGAFAVDGKGAKSVAAAPVAGAVGRVRRRFCALRGLPRLCRLPRRPRRRGVTSCPRTGWGREPGCAGALAQLD